MTRKTLYFSFALLIILAVSASRWTAAQDVAATDSSLARSGESDDQGAFDSYEYDDEGPEEAWDDEDEDWDEEHDEEYDDQLEEELVEMELITAYFEHTEMLAEICEDHARTASWAISEIHEHLDEAEAAAFLQELLSEVEEPSVRRLIQLNLAQLHSNLDQKEQTKSQLRQLILGS